MPKVVPDYSKTQIYKLKNKNDFNDENIYVGHTTNWIQRKKYHKSCCNKKNHKEYNTKKYIFIRENGGWEEWDMYWIEDYPCNIKREAEAREQYQMDLNNSKLNIIKAFSTKEQQSEYNRKYREDHKEEKIAYCKNYYKGHKEEIKAYNKNNYEKNKENITCECGAIICKAHYYRHTKTKKHINWFNTKIVEEEVLCV